MSTRKSTFLYLIPIILAAMVAGMVLAARWDLTPRSLAGALNVPAANSAPISGPIDATTFRTIAHDASPAVVSIVVTVKRTVPTIGDFFGFSQPPGRQRRAPQNEQPAPEEYGQGAGSGFVIDKAGYILTNNHVVEDATEIRVFLENMDQVRGETGLSAKVVGRDPLTDTALIQLTQMPEQGLTEVRFGDSSQIAPGDWVMSAPSAGRGSPAAAATASAPRR
jgi:serine protease Do